MTKKNVLFLCTGNSCRSQMAEGWARHFHGDTIEAYSAGIEAHGMNPNAMQVMKEAGVDISSQSSYLSESTLALSVGTVWIQMTAAGSHRPTATATRLGPCKVRVDIANDGNLPRIFLPIAPNID